MCLTTATPPPAGGVAELLPPPDLEHLTDALDRITPQRGAALRVLDVVADPRSGCQQVAEALSCDATLATRVLRTANSAYYGLAGRVPTLTRAVAVVGFETVQSLVGVALAGLDTSGQPAPDGFWEEATRVATAAGLLARPLGVPQPQAFCAGLLHDLGTAVLHRLSPPRYVQAVQRAQVGGPGSYCAAERDVFGMDHTQVGVRLMESWQFPLEIVSAVGQHHNEVGPQPLDRLVRLSVLLVQGRPSAADVVRLSAGRVDPGTVPRLRDEVDRHAAELAAALHG